MRRLGFLLLLPLLIGGLILACGRGGCAATPTPEGALPPVGAGTPRETTATPFPTSDAPLTRLVIPAIEIDQPTVPGTVDRATNTMVSPDGPWGIAYYDYSARPGHGNAVFAGHVDYIHVGAAVFWRLRDLRPGDAIVLRLSDGLELRYEVTLNRVYDAEDGPWNELLGADAAPDAVTLVTCDGRFSRATGEYSERRVVRAVRKA
jgi:LPXTG-site transpeptidase (sortase) family protein